MDRHVQADAHADTCTQIQRPAHLRTGMYTQSMYTPSMHTQ